MNASFTNATATMMRANFVMPVRQITLMLVVVVLVAAGSYAFFELVERIFLATPYLNGVIIGVFVVGILACFWQIVQIVQSVIWLDEISGVGVERRPSEAPRLLAPLASLFEQSGSRVQISSTSARSILDSVASRMDESRDVTRYLSNLLIFLGLLGTFFGLATTVPAVLDTIKSISPGANGTAIGMFQRLMTGIETQLSGMGVAFSSSLLGLAGSLVVGLLDLFAGHGQNRFYRELEEWISTITSLGTTQIDRIHGEDGGQSADYALLVGIVDELKQVVLTSESLRIETLKGMQDLSATVSRMITAMDRRDRSDAERDAASKELAGQFQTIAETQHEILKMLKKVSVGIADSETRMLLQSIELQLLRMLKQDAGKNRDVGSDAKPETDYLPPPQ